MNILTIFILFTHVGYGRDLALSRPSNVNKAIKLYKNKNTPKSKE